MPALLYTFLKMKLKKLNNLPLDKFIDFCLYDKKIGYYMNNNPLGKNGDFVTAPLISPLFSEMIFIWVISYWIKIGKPNKFSFVELGPGDGSFCKTFCRILKRFSEFEQNFKVY